MAGELDIMNAYFFDRLVNDSEFLALFGENSLANRIGAPLAAQNATPPLVNIRDLGAYDGGVLRIYNQGNVVWIQHRFLVVAIAQARRYPGAIANRMEELFVLNAALEVTEGTIFHCYLQDPYSTQYVADGKIYMERGAYWIVAAKAN